ncbi:SAM-dependent methyltransferase [Gordonia humi]|uniref:SAM-dependent methyltransferase n=1 Tax=Gordonia humi TaxID=686429 RepID=A0A840EUA3_9ACTN|nr:class I SAM-dependent methyltransferase [Gordonia humi]MBB4135272.1 SAM-dependent methyltransferase [Gordonia humi]
MTDPLHDLFVRAHDGLPRQAPGSDSTLRLLLRLVDGLPERPRIADIGCGPGTATVSLVRETGGTATGFDTHEPFLAALRERALESGVSGSVSAVNASMLALPVGPGGVDLVWAEGSAYIMGFDAALAAWRPLIRDGGAAVVTECEWLVDEPSAEAAAFWEAYPAMRTTPENVAAAWSAGYRVDATYVLPDSDWDEYYVPLAARIEQMRADGVDEQALAAIGEEIDLRRRCAHEYGYTAYVLRPR